MKLYIVCIRYFAAASFNAWFVEKPLPVGSLYIIVCGKAAGDSFSILKCFM